MKRFIAVLLMGLLLFAPLAQATMTFDDTKTMSRNQTDAFITIANALLWQLNDVLFVDGDRADTYTADGSVAHPYKTIAAAKAASASGDVILVAPGAYSETVTLTSGTTLFGWNVTGATLTGNYILLNGGVLNISTSAIVLNEESGDIDTRIESNDVTDAFVVDAGKNAVQFGAWADYQYVAVEAQSYSISASSRASAFLSNYSATGASTIHLMTGALEAGRVITIADIGGAAAGAEAIVIDTEASEKISGQDTYSVDGDYHAVTLISNGSHWFVINEYD